MKQKATTNIRQGALTQRNEEKLATNGKALQRIAFFILIRKFLSTKRTWEKVIAELDPSHRSFKVEINLSDRQIYQKNGCRC